jgi:hypothetical protein
VVSITFHHAVPLTAEQRREAVAALAELLAAWWASNPTNDPASEGSPLPDVPNS